jgi:hypothetical protein
VLFHQGESLVTRARNNCVAQFLANPHWTHLFWIDADIGFSAQAAFRLLLSGYDIAAGVYPLKRENWPAEGVPQARRSSSSSHLHALHGQRQGVRAHLAGRARGAARRLHEDDRGADRLHGDQARVFERLMASYPDLNYVPDSIGEADQGLHYRFFDVMVDPETRRYLSEDYGFCRLWSGLGESIYIDANSNLTHQGAKMYRGDFASSLLTSLPHAVGGPAGADMVLKGQEYLQPNLPPAERQRP